MPLLEELRHEMQHVFDFGIENCQTHAQPVGVLAYITASLI